MTEDEARKLAEIEARAAEDDGRRTHIVPVLAYGMLYDDRAWLIAALRASEAEVAKLREDIRWFTSPPQNGY